jgi:hypothetical protein
VELYRHHVHLIEESLAGRDLDQIDRELELQNRNPVKMLTSGPERRVADPFESSGKIRHEERVPWWEAYADPDLCGYGHHGAPPGQPHGQGRAVCIDYAVAIWQPCAIRSCKHDKPVASMDDGNITKYHRHSRLGIGKAGFDMLLMFSRIDCPFLFHKSSFRVAGGKG